MRVKVPDGYVQGIRELIEDSFNYELNPRETLAASGLLNIGLDEDQKEKALASARWEAGSLTYILHVDPPTNFITLR